MKSRLVCWVSPFNGLAVITSQQRLDQVKAIHDARTWGDFAEADPAAFEEVREAYEGECKNMEMPSPSSPFDVSMVPGFDEGDYPPWLQAEIDQHVPRDILNRYGSPGSTVLNGPFWAVDAKKLDALAEALQRRGYEVTRVDDLPFQ